MADIGKPGAGWSTQVQAGAVETTPLTPSKTIKPRKAPQPLNISTNVLLGYRLDQLSQMANANFVLAILCLIFCGLNVALIYFVSPSLPSNIPIFPGEWTTPSSHPLSPTH